VMYGTTIHDGCATMLESSKSSSVVQIKVAVTIYRVAKHPKDACERGCP